MNLKELQEKLEALDLSIERVYFAPACWRADLFRGGEPMRAYACGQGPDLESAILDALDRAQKQWGKPQDERARWAHIAHQHEGMAPISGWDKIGADK